MILSNSTSNGISILAPELPLGIGISLSAAAAFTPSTLSGLVLWLDATDNSTITQVANSVSAWNDKSTAGHNYTATTGHDPVLTPNVQNGQQGIKFTGSQGMTTPTTPIGTGATAFTIIIVLNSSNYSSNFSTALVFNGGGNPQLLFQNSGSFGPIGWLSNGGFSAARASAVTLVNNTFYAISLTYDGTGAATGYQFYLSNAAQTTTTATLNAGPAGNFLGCDGLNSSPLLGNIGEVIIYNRVLTSSERAQVQTYINGKWAL